MRINEVCGSAERTLVLLPDGTCQRVEARYNGQKTSSLNSWARDVFRNLFLPEGYPQSVSQDYTWYQLCDTMQALCSSVTGTLSTRAILKGVGVGEAEATALGGLAQWVLRDGVGMVGRIAFATVISSDLDNDAKRWRLAADITNDIGLMLEVASSHFPSAWFLVTVSVANLFKAVTCVAGGATRASLTQHFACRQNMADVAAKDGSQETAVNLLGMFLGMAVASLVPETVFWTAILFAFFTTLHLTSNYLAVRYLVLDRLNENRLLHCLGEIIRGEPCPTPSQAGKCENIVLPNRRLATIHMAVSLEYALRGAAEKVDARKLVSRVKENRFAVVRSGSNEACVILAETVAEDATLLLEAYIAALATLQPEFAVLTTSNIIESLSGAGWNLDRLQLRVSDFRLRV